MIHKVWRKWQDSPVIVSFAESSTPVWQVPFPAVTICSEAKSQNKLFNLTNAIYKNITDARLVNRFFYSYLVFFRYTLLLFTFKF